MTGKKKCKTDPEKLRGTDEPFLRLMGIGGDSFRKPQVEAGEGITGEIK